MSQYWGSIALLAALGAGAFVAYYFSEDRRRPLIPNEMTAEFKEPGSGVWMPMHFSLYYAMSDSGGNYEAEGYPWWSLERALAATRDSADFLKEYGLRAEDISVPEWRPDTGDWDDMTRCNLLLSIHLHEFWREQDPQALEYR